MLLNITLPLPLYEEFTYYSEENLPTERVIGCRVAVKFNGRNITGIVTSVPEKTLYDKLSEIIEILDDSPVLPAELLKFCKWISEYYLCPLGEVIRLALPSLLQTKTSKTASLTGLNCTTGLSERDKAVLEFIKEFDPVKLEEVEKLFGTVSAQAISNLRKKGLISVNSLMEHKDRSVYLKGYRKTVFWDVLLKTNNSVRGFDGLDQCFDGGDTVLLKELKEKKVLPSAIKKALTDGMIKEEMLKKDHMARLMAESVSHKDMPELNEEQRSCSDEVITSINENKHRTFLIHGITGSGKTIVYISAISKALEKGRTAIVLVPEISLTPQTVRRFRSHFGNKIAVLHSRLSDPEKLENWEKIRLGEYPIVIGPRSAVFAPLKNIGVIIVDEEHDSSYKQTDTAPRYCARNSAVMRGFFNKAPVVLGSATPSLESYYNAVSGKYRLLEIKNRFRSAVLPVMKIVKKENFSEMFEKPVITLFCKELALGRKIMVLQNRRGYSPHLICRSCGKSSSCPNCSVSLTYHLDRNRMICHYCGYFEKGKDRCGSCGSENISFRGAGTEQVESELKRIFPGTAVLRMDYDTTRKKDGHSRILDEFDKPGAAILVGTQMIAKGLDFHQVSVVCIVNIDSELIFPDFRSDEKAFQLIEQVAGRAGRGAINGKVIIQTFNESNQLLRYALNHDYLGFINEELNIRKMTSYPPFSRIIIVTLSSKDLAGVKKTAEELYSELSSVNKSCVIYKPVDKMVLKVNNIFRLYILIKSSIINDRSGKISRDLVSGVLGKFKSSSDIKIDTDVDPAGLM
ncbi:TPA: primosomal protein N' [Candidatus Delongbacteria bacterium]|nr:primosomal protein N' [Candidatus Delongbacteria bacterium]